MVISGNEKKIPKSLPIRQKQYLNARKQMTRN